MKLKFQVLDKSQNGFARYCPSFAKAYDCITDKAGSLQIRYISRSYGAEGLLARLQKNPNDVKHVAKLLAYNEDHRKAGAKALNGAATLGVSMQDAVPALANALWDSLDSVSWSAASALTIAAKSGINTAVIVPQLIRKLGKGDVQQQVALILGYAAINENTRELTIRKLVNSLRNKREHVNESAGQALKIAAEKGTQETLDAITTAINGLSQSKWFMIELGRNSALFVETVKCCANLMAIVKSRYISCEIAAKGARLWD